MDGVRSKKKGARNRDGRSVSYDEVDGPTSRLRCGIGGGWLDRGARSWEYVDCLLICDLVYGFASRVHGEKGKELSAVDRIETEFWNRAANHLSIHHHVLTISQRQYCMQRNENPET